MVWLSGCYHPQTWLPWKVVVFILGSVHICIGNRALRYLQRDVPLWLVMSPTSMQGFEMQTVSPVSHEQDSPVYW